MRKVLSFSLFLMLGLVASQLLPGLLGPGYSSFKATTDTLLYVCLGFIMINVGREFEIDKSRWRSYTADYFIAMATAALPWLLIVLYYVFVLLPAPLWGSPEAWKENLLLSRFAAPTSAGILFTMLAALKLKESWIYRKIQVLAIFDDLDTILLMIPLQILMIGLRWQMFAIVAIVAVLLVVGWRWQATWNVRQDWKRILGLSVIVCALTQAVYLATKHWYGAENSIHIEVLLPAFVVGMLMRHRHIDTPAERRVATGISFLFTTVAANAIAIVGTNPVSGMTLMTLILASVVMVAVGLKGPGGMVAALVMGGVVCTALSMAGGFITDLKIGYWLGSTPVKQETWKFLGTIVSAATVGGVMIILNKTYGFTSGQLAAPQANAMAAVIEPLMNGVGAPWLLYGIGAVLAIVLNACKIPALAFALGMFIPLELNVPLVVGGAVNWYVTSRSKDAALNAERGEKGTLLASGFIAGGALMGVVSAAMRFGGVNMVNNAWLSNTWSEVLALGAYVILIFYLVKASMKTK
mgnify:CR=1 FL=1